MYKDPQSELSHRVEPVAFILGVSEKSTVNIILVNKGKVKVNLKDFHFFKF